ncbi:cytochrome c [Methyloceanibacter sp.]|uniref:c-type cytochrome n=1 Tax=Methyloceanibacter sp. TaxID=1965321 RepID=UPI002CC54CFD|nr:cytochrome c [Methyloceanibacter sp.]HML93012.1 cytochrome c [Methyloceanibacter sp.]
MLSSGRSSVAKAGLIILWVGAAALAGLGVATSGIYFGLYNVAADEPHSQSVYRLLQTIRDRSIAVRATAIDVPADLSDSERIGSGGGQYAEMCSSCHLAPGMERTEISRGLYPRAPELRRGSRATPAEDFWVVKHGIKATGMPAWGVTHSDKLLWDIVAFVRRLPELSSDEYKEIINRAPRSHDEIMEEMKTNGSQNNHAH